MKSCLNNRIFNKVRSSLVVKIFIVSFVCVHIPLLGAIAFLLTESEMRTQELLAVLLAATLFGTIMCLWALWVMIRPLIQLRHALVAFDNTQQLNIPERVLAETDEIGALANTTNKLVSRLQNLTRELNYYATTDDLTGLRNRRWLLENMSAKEPENRTWDVQHSLILFDIDHFKQINDQYGHNTGDTVLAIIGEAIRKGIQPTDLAARIGGEEFCIVMKNANAVKAAEFADHLRNTIEQLNFPTISDRKVTCSFGITDFRPDEKLTSAFKRADRALYHAKSTGRNRIVRDFIP